MTKFIAKYSLALVILFASLVNATMTYQKAKDIGLKFRFLDFLGAMVLSSFAGTMFGFLGLSMSLDKYEVLMMAGVGGFLGVTGLNALINRYLKRKLGDSQ